MFVIWQIKNSAGVKIFDAPYASEHIADFSLKLIVVYAATKHNIEKLLSATNWSPTNQIYLLSMKAQHLLIN